MSVEVAFTAGQPSTARALILNSDSRAMSAAAAADKVAALLRGAATFVPHWQVKKIDSTLRGNPGGELEAMMAAQGCRMAVVARLIRQPGGIPGRALLCAVVCTLDQTEFASDPNTPSRAEISEIIAMQSRLPCLTLNAGQLPAALATAGEEKRVLIVDAWEDSHLDQVIDAVRPCAGDPAGRLGGFCAGAGRLRRSEQGPLLAVVGSMSEMAQRQVAALQVHSRVRVIEIDVEQAFSGSPKEEASRIAGALREGQHCVVTTRPNHAARHGIEARCRERGLSRAAYGEHICAWLADVTALVVALCPPGALYLSGGDVAIAVAHALGATGFQIRGRVAECVPYGHFLGGRWSRPVMTKAGGFGTDTTLLHVVNFIEEKLSV
ncbi:four-carbon acid sugar kinase family protein [Klebsiella pneumoniae]|uniref:four-carbon acid sugar kinase family protein n=1 Tax=Klebsiella pneumoniae TaxID=573 RepID=UPI003F6E0723